MEIISLILLSIFLVTCLSLVIGWISFMFLVKFSSDQYPPDYVSLDISLIEDRIIKAIDIKEKSFDLDIYIYSALNETFQRKLFDLCKLYNFLIEYKIDLFGQGVKIQFHNITLIEKETE